jgi:exosortase
VAGAAALPQPGTVGALPRNSWLTIAGIVTVIGAWIYWRTIFDLTKFWNEDPDYSHGFLVAPFAAVMLWMRRDRFPAASAVPAWGGLVVLLVSVAIRYVGLRLFLTPLAGWAMILWLVGAVWLLAGRRVAVWAAPALLFLLFMIPLPFRIENMLSWHLQTITTNVSTVILECCTVPAIAEGHTIFLGEQTLEVEQACSGLRMFMGIAAVAFALIVLQRRSWLESAILILAVAPVAMLSNSLRVVITGLLLMVVNGEAAAHFSHDAAGWVMIVTATALFSAIAAYVQRLIITSEVQEGTALAPRPGPVST